jgi:hypothetical protein
MKELLDLLKQQPKEVLLWIVLELMKDGTLSFTDIAEIHVKYLELLKKGETEKLMQLRSKVIALWTVTKKDLPKSLVNLIQEGKDQGWVNINQEQIDSSKWNR